MNENTTTSPGDTKAALPPATCSACLGEWRPEGEQAVIDATFDANDRVRERRFAQGLPCLLTGLTKEQWEAARQPVPGTEEYDEDTELMQEADDAMDRLSWSRPNRKLSHPASEPLTNKTDV